MSAAKLPVGAFVALPKAGLQAVVDCLRQRGYRIVGPQVLDGAIVYDDLDRTEQLPLGVLDVQDGGLYRIKTDSQAGYFDHVVGPNSLKNFVFPPRETLLKADQHEGAWTMTVPDPPHQPVAVLGARSCDLHALAVQDRVFLHGPYIDPGYQARREGLFLVAVNCRRAAATCFCHSMKTGPVVTSTCDLTLTELDHCFVVEVGTERGGEVVAAGPWSPCTSQQMQRAADLPRQLAVQMHRRVAGVGAQRNLGESASGLPRNSAEVPAEPGFRCAPTPATPPRERQLDTTDIRDLLLGNLEHARWQKVAERCLACGNCTMVCPTCFCSSVEEVTDLTGEHTARERSWASCFTAEHSYMNSGTVRKSIAARYRQWLTHKLASWIDQFGVSGCVGCGRCITWCPVGIDLTEEVAAIREGA